MAGAIRDMIEREGDLWNMDCNWLCITTNGIIRSDGKAVMGRGVALQAKERIPLIDTILAEKLIKNGNIVSALLSYENKWIISFPTKHNWRDKSDLDLIISSAQQLKKHFDSQSKKPIVLLPRPGCANGGLEWSLVKDAIKPILTDDEFIIVHNGTDQ